MKKTFIILTAVVLILIIGVSLLTFSGFEKEKNPIEKDTTFYIDKESKIVDFPSALLLNLENSYITLRTDGTITMHFAITDAFAMIANSFVDLSLLQTIDIEGFAHMYADPVVPGFDLYDLPGSLKLLTDSIGLEITGLDFNDKNIVSLTKTLTEKVPLIEGFTIPKNLGIEYNGPYFIKKVHSDYSGDHIGVFVGKHDEDSDPFIIMTMTEENTKVSFSIDVLSTYISAVTEKA